MIIVRLKGGMGNQMFQYALGRVLSIRNNTKLKLDTTTFGIDIVGNVKREYCLDIFNIEADIATFKEVPLLFRFYKNKYIARLFNFLKRFIENKGREKGFVFYSCILEAGDDLFLDGFWQSPKYFSEIEDVIRKGFYLKKGLSPKSQVLFDEINNQKSLCVNVRRGDFVGNSYHEVVGNDFYTKGLKVFENMNMNFDKVYVFSDDIQWCKNNLKFGKPTIFVDYEYSGEKFGEYLYLMSACRLFIIPNSSFAWWGAWLSLHKDKRVICPNQWFGDANINSDDLIPNDWIRI